MAIYSHVLRFLNVFNLVAGAMLTVASFFNKKAFIGGTALNQIAAIFSIEAFGLILVLSIIFSVMLGSDTEDVLFKPQLKHIILYVVFSLNALCRMFFHGNAEIENGTSFTSDKVLATIALSLLINLSAFILSNNYIHSTKMP